MAARLLFLPRDPVPSLGHTDFPEVTEVTELWDLITAKSGQFFDIVKSDPKWLTQSVSDWALDTDYARILTKDSTMRRGILNLDPLLLIETVGVQVHLDDDVPKLESPAGKLKLP